MMRAFLWTLLCLPALASAELDQWDKNQIRQYYQESVFNRPAEISNKPVDQKYTEKLFPSTVTIDQPLYAPLPEIPSLQVFTGRELPFERFLSLLSKTIGYESPQFLHVPASLKERPIILNSQVHDLPALVSWLEVRTGTRIAVYPDSKTIQVSAPNDYSTNRQRD